MVSRTALKSNAYLVTAQIALLLCALAAGPIAYGAKCPNEPREVVGTIYCDNAFTLWVNGVKVAVDPIEFTPHQAVQVMFKWDGISGLTYAIQCEDFASESGYEYTQTRRPQLGDGALIATFNDGLDTVTSARTWKVHTVTYGPTEASRGDGCSSANLAACVVENRGTPAGWNQPDFDDSSWKTATAYTATQAGWGRRPSWSSTKGCCTMTSPHNRSSLGCDATVGKSQCLDPRAVFSNSTAQFIWAKNLELDNRVLFRYTARCERE